MPSMKVASENPAGFTASRWGVVARAGALVRTVIRRGATLILVAAAVLGGAYAVWRYGTPDVSDRPEYHVAIADVQITDPPPWVRADVRDEVQQLAGLSETLSLLDADVLEEVAQAFALHPWVAEVKRVQKRYPSTLRVELRYRRPVAMVEVAGGLLAIDADAVLLPSRDFSPQQARHYPRIRGVLSTPAGSAGTRWGDPLVAGAAKIAGILAPVWEELELAAIQGAAWRASKMPGDGIYYLYSRGGSRILWGRPPDTDHPGELAAEEKIARLRRYVQQHGSLEAPDGPYELDIRHWREISRRPRLVR